MKLYLIRHGEYSAVEHLHCQVDGPLTEKGMQQAGDTAGLLARKSVHKVYASDMRRAAETAGIIADRLGLKVESRAELREIYRGEWENADPKEPRYAEYYRQWSAHQSDMPYPGGECGLDVLRRARKLLDTIVPESSRDDSIALVTHGGVVRTLLAELSGLDQARRFDFNPGLCSVTTVEIDEEGKYRLTSLCNADHLQIGNGTKQEHAADADGPPC